MICDRKFFKGFKLQSKVIIIIFIFCLIYNSFELQLDNFLFVILFLYN